MDICFIEYFKEMNLLPPGGVFLGNGRFTFHNQTMLCFKVDNGYYKVNISHPHSGDPQEAFERTKRDIDDLYGRTDLYRELCTKKNLFEKKFDDSDGILDITFIFG